MRLIGRMSVFFGLVFSLVLLLGLTRPAASQLDGRHIFRFDTFGDEQLWTNVLRMHEVVASLDPVTALGVGLKVDVDALPDSTTRALRAGLVDLTRPNVTAQLLQLNAVVGARSALCHSSTIQRRSRWTRYTPSGQRQASIGLLRCVRSGSMHRTFTTVVPPIWLQS